MRLVAVSPHVPFAGIDHAGGDYLLEYLNAAHSAGWSVTVVCPDTVANRRGSAKAPQWLTVVSTSERTAPSVVRAWRLVRRGVSALPPRAWYRRLDSQTRSALSSATLIDLQWMASIQYAPLLREKHPHIPITATPHDVKSVATSRARQSPRRLVAILARLSLPAILRTERSAISACSRVFVFKPEDVSVLMALGARTQVRTTPPLVHRPVDEPAADPSSSLVLFPAAFWRDENDEAARWFLGNVWPLISRQLPDARVRFGGGGPSSWLQSQSSGRVEVTGYMPDLMDAYRGVAAVIAPLQRGAGLKFKVAQAVAMGYPVIGTSVAVEGVNSLTGRPSVRAFDDPHSFAAEVIEVLSDARTRIAAAQEEARMVATSLDFDAGIRVQLDAYAELTAPDQ